MQQWQKSIEKLWQSTNYQWLIFIFAAATMLCIMVGIYYINNLFWLAPAALLIGYLAFIDFKKVFFLLFASIPISIEYTFPNGFSTDLPTEPLMLLLMGVTFLYVLLHVKKIDYRVLRHPLTLLLLLHIGWTLVTTVASESFTFSLKFFLAKIWYITVFYFLATKLVKTENDLKNIFKIVFFPLVLAVILVETKHAQLGFTFDSINFCVGPYFRNHVSYAALTALFLPFCFYALRWFKAWSWQWCGYLLGTLVILAGVQFSYTRAAYAALIIAFGMYFVIRWRLMKVVLVIAVVFFGALGTFLVKDNNFMGFAPDYKKTIMHQSFDNLLEATYKFQDISTMERVYRWVAAGHMIDDKPYLGFGPGNFYNFYQHYVVATFRTYVSDNPEKSGIHCYFLMVLVEQGALGLLFFLLFNFGVLLLAEKTYHDTKDKKTRHVILMMALSFTVINALLLINDMIETDKVGTFYFFCAAILVNIDLKRWVKND
jgi:O-antigen ligase